MNMLKNKILKNRLRIIKEFAIEHDIRIKDLFKRDINIERINIILSNYNFLNLDWYFSNYYHFNKLSELIYDKHEKKTARFGIESLFKTAYSLDTITSIEEAKLLVKTFNDYGILPSKNVYLTNKEFEIITNTMTKNVVIYFDGGGSYYFLTPTRKPKFDIDYFLKKYKRFYKALCNQIKY